MIKGFNLLTYKFITAFISLIMGCIAVAFLISVVLWQLFKLIPPAVILIIISLIVMYRYWFRKPFKREICEVVALYGNRCMLRSKDGTLYNMYYPDCYFCIGDLVVYVVYSARECYVVPDLF